MSSSVIMPEPSEGPEPTSGARRTAVVAAITAGTLAVVGVGAYAAVTFLSGGAGAESAMPAQSTLAVVSLDLDPSAQQKIEALKTLQKFPQLKQQLKLGSGDDPRQQFFDQSLRTGDCKASMSYTADIKPWIGDNVAIGAASFDKGKISPLVSLAVTDQGKATRALDALIQCSKSQKDLAYAFNGDFVLISDTRAHADLAVSQAKARALSDDAAYKSWTSKVGNRGILNFYVAEAAAATFSDYALDYGKMLTPAPATAFSSGGTSAPYAGARTDSTAGIRKALKDFRGAAGAVRFADGGVELHVVGGLGTHAAASGPVSDVVSGLPSDTAAVLAMALPKDWASKLTASLGQLGGGLLGTGDLTRTLHEQLGLTLPGDLQTLLGDGLAVAVRGTPPGDLTHLSGPEQVPAGLVVKGDPAAIRAVIAKLEHASGGSLKDAGVSEVDGGGKLALGFDPAYAKSLLGGGGLGNDGTFTKVVPEVGHSSAVVYVNFNSPWRAAIGKAIADGGDAKGARQFLDNTGPLQAFGFSSWVDGADTHYLVKLTTD